MVNLAWRKHDGIAGRTGTARYPPINLLTNASYIFNALLTEIWLSLVVSNFRCIGERTR